ncbi:MAG: ABC transporter substrate-binding protein [Chloroflexi bacterium]|nr:ABC transporter substrate-binding protein [Chloroflexota bacterium]
MVLTKYRLLILMAAMFAIFALVACQAEPQIVEVERVVEVEKEVPVEVEVERVVEVEREVPVEVETVVEREVPVEVQVEVERVVEREVPVEVEVERVVEVEKIVEVMAPEGPKEEIAFSDLNWSSAQLQNRVAQYIVEKGYGYPTSATFGSTLPLFQGLLRGDTHVTMEIWLPNQTEAWNEARADGSVYSVGKSLGNDWQSAFVIPAYLQEEYPELDHIDDLRDPQYKDLFKSAETGDKARLVSCIIGWACEVVNAAQVSGYGLDDHVEIVNPGDGAALNADLYGAYEKGEPWLGYQWGTNDPSLILDLVRLEEPAYSDECWLTNKACAYEDAEVLIAINPDLAGRAPDVVEMLRKWDYNIEVYKTAARWQAENPDADVNSTALWWLNSFPEIWGEWVTEDAKASITAALGAGESADGWPEG